jgi:hypothetical protein
MMSGDEFTRILGCIKIKESLLAELVSELQRRGSKDER